MYLFVVALHVVLCLFMILIILLQPAKGEVGLAFGGGGGGGGGGVFGPRGPASILQRATTVVAVMFMGTSITLALYSNQSMMATGNVDDEFDEISRENQQGAEAAPAPEPGAEADPAGEPSLSPE
jgi:preprotein translocase subunit SecG